MNKKPISSESLDNEMRGFSAFGPFTAKTVPAAREAAASKTEAHTPPMPDDNGNTDMTSKRRKPSNAGTMRNTARQSKSCKNGKTDKFVAKTYKFPPKLIELVDRVAYWRRQNKQDIIAEALIMFFDSVPEEDKQEIKRKR